MGAGAGRIDAGQTGIAVDMGELAMMLPALPKLVEIDQLLFPAGLAMDIGYQAAGHAHRVEQDAVGILQDLEFQIPQGVADMLCKTGTRQHNFILVPDKGCWRIDPYWQLKFHVWSNDFVNRSPICRRPGEILNWPLIDRRPETYLNISVAMRKLSCKASSF